MAVRFVLFFVLLFAFQPVFEQEIDSLILESNRTTDPHTKVDLLITAVQKLEYIDNDSANYYAEIAYKESVTGGYLAGEVLALIYKSNYLVNKGENQSAIDLIKQAESISERLGNKLLLAKTYMCYGDLFYHSMLYDKSFESYSFASKIFLQLNQKNEYYNCICQLGILYAKQEKNDDALRLFQQALEGARGIKATDIEARALNNIATVYKNTGKLNEALELYKTALTLNFTNQNYKFILNNLGNIAFVYIALNDTINSMKYFDSTLYFALKVKDTRNALYTRINKSKILFFQGRYDLIENDLIEILSIAEKSGWTDLSLECSDVLSELYARKHDFKKAYDYSQKRIEFYEMTQSEGNTRKLSELQFKYNFEKETLMIDAKNHQKSILIIALLVLTVLLIILTIIIYIQYKTRAAKTLLEHKNLKLEKDKLNLQQQNLTNQLELKNKEITSSIILLQKKNDLLASIANKLMEAKNQFTQTNWNLIEKCIEELRENTDDSDRQNFEYYFNQVYESFYKKLFEINPNLTPNERRLCAYIKLQMSTKEIATLTNSSQRSVEVARYRLRKKLNISNLSVSINTFLEEL